MRFNVGEVQASNGKVKVRAWMSSQGTLHQANNRLDRLNPDHPGKVAGANIEAAALKETQHKCMCEGTLGLHTPA